MGKAQRGFLLKRENQGKTGERLLRRRKAVAYHAPKEELISPFLRELSPLNFLVTDSRAREIDHPTEPGDWKRP
jgi:hypothetical protein